jgi:hypothetical protein
MADMMDRGFEKARALGLPAWQRPSPPDTARYTAINFTPGAPPVEPRRQVARPFGTPPNAPATGRTITDLVSDTTPGGRPPDAPALAMTRVPAPQGGDSGDTASGGWAIQLGGTFATRAAADAALRTAIGRLPELRSEAQRTVVPLKGARGHVTYRARLTNLDESDAARGCHTLRAARLFFCTPVATETRAE